MSLRHVANIVGVLLSFLALTMLVTGVVGWGYEDSAHPAFFLSALITAVCGGALWWVNTPLRGDFTAREGFATVTFAWTATGLFGALPFLLSGVTDELPRAIFESMSGFTTTGATIFGSIETLPESILFWRSLTHWLGGMGIIVLAVAILPFLGVGGMQLFRAEVTGPTPERLRPRIAQTAKLLWLVYVGLTGLQTALYLAGGMGGFDAVNHALSTLATGGFSTKDASMAHFDSAYIQWVTIVFMYLAGINFALHFRAATGRPVYWKDAEWRFFTLALLGTGGALALTNLLTGTYAGEGWALERAVRDALFQVTSIATTTGFVSADYSLWVPASQGIILTLFFLGGMAGSTAGGIKVIRILVLLKHTANELRKQLHPRAVLLVRLGRQVVREDILATVLGFVILYTLLMLAGAFVLALFGNDLLTAFAASAATVGNIGPGFGKVGPVDNYGWMSGAELLVLSFLMVVGRLEIFTVLLLFRPEFWRKRRKGDPGGKGEAIYRVPKSRSPASPSPGRM
jgi:trk system potassium uptake protein